MAGRRTREASLVAVLITAVTGVAGFGGTGESGSSVARQAAASAEVITCPQHGSQQIPMQIHNRTGITLKLTTAPVSVSCNEWSATGNPTNFNRDGGTIIPVGDHTQLFERWDGAATNEILRAATWTMSVVDAPMASSVGTLLLDSHVDRGTTRLSHFYRVKAAGDAGYVCRRENTVRIGSLRGKQLLASTGSCISRSSNYDVYLTTS